MVLVLLAILFCLALQRFANVGGIFQVSWFESYLRLIGTWVAKLDTRLIILAVVAPVLLILFFIHVVFHEYWFNLIDLLLAVAVLFVSIDARDLKVQLAAYFDALEQSDAHKAADSAADFIGDAPDMTNLHRSVTKAVLQRSFERLFAGLFWFMIFNFYGVATYFMVVMLRRTATKVNPGYVELENLATKIQNVLDWLPARLLGFAYALAGHFRKGSGYIFKHIWSDFGNAREIVVEAGLNSLDVDPNSANADKCENESALDMVNRALIIWIVALVLVLIGKIL